MAARRSRLQSPEDTVNEVLLNRQLRHAIFVERFKNEEVRKILSLLNQLHEELLEKLRRRLGSIRRRGFDPGPITTARLSRLLTQVGDVLGKNQAEIRRALVADLRELARIDLDFQARAIETAMPVTMEVTLPAAQLLHSVIASRPFDGKLIREHFLALERAERDAYARAIRLGIAEGQTTDEIIRRIRGTRAQRFTDGTLQRPRRFTEALVRTSITHVSNHARETLFETNSDLVNKVQWVSTLDDSTCPICMDLDGKTFPVGGGVRPPVHMNCRCTTVPVVKSWKELGLDVPDAPPGLRASVDGLVPETLKYPEWLGRQSAAFQDEVLGKTRGRLFRRGGLEVGDFVDSRRNVLTLDQLRRIEPDAFERAGL